MGKQKFQFWNFHPVLLAEQEHPNSQNRENIPVPTRAPSLSWDNPDTPQPSTSPAALTPVLHHPGTCSRGLCPAPAPLGSLDTTHTPHKDHPIPRAAARRPSWAIPLWFHVEMEIPTEDTQFPSGTPWEGQQGSG